MDGFFANLIKSLEILSPEVLLILGFFTCMAFILLAFRYFGAFGLVCYSVLAVTIANIQVLKLGVFSYIQEPIALGTVVFTTLFTTSDLITEHYGAALARKTIYLTFLMQIFVMLSMVFVIAHPESGEQISAVHQGLETLFTPSLRLFIASLIAFGISQHIDIGIFESLKKRHGRHLLWLRGNVSTLISGIFDTVIFSILAWIILAPNPLSFTTVLIGFIGFSQLLRAFISIFSTPLLYISYRIKPYDL
jgi:uncharacterized integral membrane protein (TIGR00697 family)